MISLLVTLGLHRQQATIRWLPDMFEKAAPFLGNVRQQAAGVWFRQTLAFPEQSRRCGVVEFNTWA
jgi:hypothetical protein